MSDQWYVKRDGEQFGPITLAELQQWAAEQRITPSDWVEGGDGVWKTAGAAGLFALPSPAQQTSPVATAPSQSSEFDFSSSGPRTASAPSSVSSRLRQKKTSVPKWAYVAGGFGLLFASCVMMVAIDPEKDAREERETGKKAGVEKRKKVSGKRVRRADYGERWAFTVDEGVVDCIDGAAVFRHGGTTYQLTGLAEARGYAKIDRIWRDNPSLPGTKVSVSPFTDLALKQCD